jgi:hypothetical protein
MAKALADMTVAEAKASGQIDAYNKLVAGYGVSAPQTTAPTLTYKPGSLETMTVAQAAKAGKTKEYNDIVAGFTTPVKKLDQSAVVVPTKKETPYPSVASGNAGLTTPTPTTTKKETSATDLFNQYINAKDTNQMPSLADQYATEEEKAGIEQKQIKVNDLTAQLNSVTAEAQQAQAILESQAGGKDVTGSFLGRQQQEVSRQLTIKALPIQAELAAAQGNLQYAQDRLTTLFTLKSKDAQNQYDYKNNLLDTVYKFATTQQQNELDAKKEEEKNNFQLYRDNLSYVRNLSISAMENGQADVAANIARLDPSSPTFSEDLAGLTGQMNVSPDTQVVKLDNGATVMINSKTGEIVKNLGGADSENTPIGSDAPLYSGLNSATSTAVRGQVGAFKSEPLVQNFAVIQEGRNLVKSLSDTTKNPVDDQALIYSLAKALDPGSVVREGEYATAQKYAQSWIKAYGKGVTQAIAGTGFLSEEARKNIKATIESKYDSSKTSYDNLYNQYAKGINSLTGRKNGTDFLRDYVIDDNKTSGGNKYEVDNTPMTSGQGLTDGGNTYTVYQE